MKALSWTRLLWVAAAGMICGSLLAFVTLRLGGTPPLMTPWLGLLFVIIAVGLWQSGRAVRKLKQNKETRMTPIHAARVALFARSGAATGSLFAGFLIGIGLVGLSRLWAPSVAASAIGAGIGAVGAIILCLVSMLVEGWCIDDSDSSRQNNRGQEPKSSGRGAHGTARGASKEFDAFSVKKW